jgi:hypothetical protein
MKLFQIISVLFCRVCPDDMMLWALVAACAAVSANDVLWFHVDHLCRLLVLGFCCGATCLLTFFYDSNQYDHGVRMNKFNNVLFCLSGFEQLYDC